MCDRSQPDLGPSRELHADFYGKHGFPIKFEQYQPRYFAEMRARKERIGDLARRVAGGETITLLCSTSCTDPKRCHRTLLKKLVETAVARVGRSRSEG